MKTSESVKKVLKEILVTKYKFPVDKVDDVKNSSLSLFSMSRIFTERELVMLFFDLERAFDIELDASLLINTYDFSTIDGISSYIVNSVKGGGRNEEIG